VNTSAVTPDTSDPVPRRRLVIGLLLLATLLVIGFWWSGSLSIARCWRRSRGRPTLEHATGRACCWPR